jgi:CheY-like chemotaxis protein
LNSIAVLPNGILTAIPSLRLLERLEMLGAKANLLIVDDQAMIRTPMSLFLGEIGYQVRTAEDGLSALVEIEKEVPNILLTDLNMPRMSGFELLSVVRRRFPSIQTIAMSGTFQGDEVPSGVAADAFFQKGSSLGALLRVMENLPSRARRAATTDDPRHSADSGQIMASYRHQYENKPWVTVE